MLAGSIITRVVRTELREQQAGGSPCPSTPAPDWAPGRSPPLPAPRRQQRPGQRGIDPRPPAAAGASGRGPDSVTRTSPPSRASSEAGREVVHVRAPLRLTRWRGPCVARSTSRPPARTPLERGGAAPARSRRGPWRCRSGRTASLRTRGSLGAVEAPGADPLRASSTGWRRKTPLMSR